ncbi:hypothetical protein [Bradyrhizobium sp. JYMT SZCCT0180]|uniref:hypothetical protein n=1 Tax=Bradyrhizobium sp. JYMT SZCCT0180 TaxID=2807666 RepID=UPI002010D10B|nr:hypothetical protein [Bradyrhizobium sp. JYMT SZCCT0180]
MNTLNPGDAPKRVGGVEPAGQRYRNAGGEKCDDHPAAEGIVADVARLAASAKLLRVLENRVRRANEAREPGALCSNKAPQNTQRYENK